MGGAMFSRRLALHALAALALAAWASPPAATGSTSSSGTGGDTSGSTTSSTSGSGGADASAPVALRVLFVGNSYTYVNDLPMWVHRLGDSSGVVSVMVDSV